MTIQTPFEQQLECLAVYIPPKVRVLLFNAISVYYISRFVHLLTPLLILFVYFVLAIEAVAVEIGALRRKLLDRNSGLLLKS